MGGRDPNDFFRNDGEAGLRAAVDAIFAGDIEVDGRIRADPGEHKRNGHAKAPTHEPYYDDRELSRGVVEPLDQINTKFDSKAEESKSKTHTKGKAADPTIINSTTWIWRDPAEIERRKWLLATHYIRGSVTGTVGKRGGGKTNRAIVEMLSMVTGLDLLKTGNMPDQRLRAWYIGEDTRDEIEMRIVAACALYGIKAEEIGDRLAFDSIYDFPPGALKLATLQNQKVMRNHAAIAAIKADMIAKRIDVLILDPLKKFHGVREGDQEMDEVMTILSEIAKETKAAVEFLHHTRKQAAGTAGTQITADDARGADAIIAGPRDVRLVNAMSTKDAIDFGISPVEAWRYSRIDDGKQNLKPPGNAVWARSASQLLLPCGESVGVLQPWTPPKLFDGISNKDMATAQQLARTGEYRADVRSSDWFGYVLGKHIGRDPLSKPEDKTKLNGMIKIWIKNKVLVTHDKKDQKGKSRSFIIPGPNVVAAQDPGFDDNQGGIE
jgi:hypothetical protein